MHLTKWIEEDGYHECFVSFTQTSAPYLKIRAVKEIDETFRPILRCHKSGEMVATSTHKSQDVELVKLLAIQLLKEFLIKEGEEVVMR